MAYNAYYPYPVYYSPYQQPIQQNIQQGIQQANGFISVRSMDEAFNWPMAPGTSLTFKDESAPYIYTKTKGFSQLEQPTFEKFRLVKEEQSPEKPPESPVETFDAKGQIETLWAEVESLKASIEALKGKSKRLPIKKEEQPDAES